MMYNSNLRLIMKKEGIKATQIVNTTRENRQKWGSPLDNAHISNIANDSNYNATISSYQKIVNAINEITGKNYTLKDVIPERIELKGEVFDCPNCGTKKCVVFGQEKCNKCGVELEW